VVGLATLLHQARFRNILGQTIRRLAPGPAGNIVLAAFRHGEHAAAGGATAALLIGLIVALVSAATAMGQIERGANRIYGVERDRPTLQKYERALLLATTAGLLTVVAFALILAGQDIIRVGTVSNGIQTAWNVLRSPLSIVLVVAAMALLFRASPRRRQPAASWLAAGSVVSVLLWLAFTGLLALYLGASKTFGQTYGPLAGMIGILLWAFLTSLALFLGLAFAAQLEAVRAGTPGPVTSTQANPTGPQQVRVRRRPAWH